MKKVIPFLLVFCSITALVPTAYALNMAAMENCATINKVSYDINLNEDGSLPSATILDVDITWNYQSSSNYNLSPTIYTYSYTSDGHSIQGSWNYSTGVFEPQHGDRILQDSHRPVLSFQNFSDILTPIDNKVIVTIYAGYLNYPDYNVEITENGSIQHHGDATDFFYGTPITFEIDLEHPSGTLYLSKPDDTPQREISIQEDSWNFKNPTSKIEKKHVTTFLPNMQAEEIQKVINASQNGVCFGMTATAINLNSQPELQTPADFSKQTVSQISKNDMSNSLGISALEYIKYLFATQVHPMISKQEKQTENDLAGLYAAVKRYESGKGAGVNIGIYGRYFGNSGHSLWGIKTIDDEQKCKILVYDCNHPKEERYIILNKDASGNFVSWQYQLFDGLFPTIWGTGKKNASISYSTYSEITYAALYQLLTGKQLNSTSENYNEDMQTQNLVSISNGNINSNNLVPIHFKGVTEQTEQSGNPEDDIYVTDNIRKLYWTESDSVTITSSGQGTQGKLIGADASIEVSSPTARSVTLGQNNTGEYSAQVDTTADDHIVITFENDGTASQQSSFTISGTAFNKSIHLSISPLRNNLSVEGFNDVTIVCETPAGRKQFTAQNTNGKTTNFDIDLNNLFTTVPATNIRINEQKISLSQAGSSYPLKAEVTPANATNSAVIWTSSNPNVATVTDSGLVTAVSNGVTTITAKTQDGGYTATCEVTVEIPEAPNIPVTNVNLNTQRITLSQVGSSYQLKAEVTPTNATNQTVVWASSNPDIATVNNSGLVTAVSEGSTTITATTQDGQKVATCFVTVRIESSSIGTSGGGSSSPATPTPHLITTGETDSGTIIISHKTASKGETVTITAVPDDGFMLETLSASDKNGNKIQLTKETDTNYIFKMPASQVTVSATFTEIVVEPELTALPFGDIPRSAWYYEAVKYVYSNHLMQGTTETTFSPDTEMNRAMIATVLYRLENSPASTGDAFFIDVETNEWYTDAILWAAQNNVITGYGNNRFGPMDSVTREQLAVILYNYTVSKGISAEAAGDLSAFSDAKATSDWAEEAMSWAVGVGLLSGKGNATLDPTGTATRAEVAQMLMNYLTKII